MILDTNLRLPKTSKVIVRYGKGEGRQPWVICRTGPDPQRKAELESVGVKVVEVSVNESTGRLDLRDMLSKLTQLSIRSLMVEGGRGIISEFLSTGVEQGLVDWVIITVSPMWVGSEGLSAMADQKEPPLLDHVKSEVMGKDSVVACRPRPRPFITSK